MLVCIASFVALLVCRAARGDDTLYRYEGDVLPYDPSAGWVIFDPCQGACTESLEAGCFVLRWERLNDSANFLLWIARPEGPVPPPTLWVEWRFQSNNPLGPNFYTCDGRFRVQYIGAREAVEMYGDAAISFSGDDFVTGLELSRPHTYRFESSNGAAFTVAVDGRVFIARSTNSPTGSSFLQMLGGGGCEGLPVVVNRWDFVRYGTLAKGEQVVSSDPPAGFVDARIHSSLDRFTVTFNAANYVYVNDITVETTGGPTPVVTATRRLENGEPDTVEIVLDRPIPVGETTRFTMTDGVAVNVVEFTYAPGDANGNGRVDLFDVATLFRCLFDPTAGERCAIPDLSRNGTVDSDDLARLVALMEGR